MNLDAATKRQLTSIISKGLYAGCFSDGKKKFCLQNACSKILDNEPHSEQPQCVHPIDAQYWVMINDLGWESIHKRAEALLPAAFAQLNTNSKSERIFWRKRVARNILTTIVGPMFLPINEEVSRELSRAKTVNALLAVYEKINDLYNKYHWTDDESNDFVLSQYNYDLFEALFCLTQEIFDQELIINMEEMSESICLLESTIVKPDRKQLRHRLVEAGLDAYAQEGRYNP